ncbi:LPXTG cell wall anchor domain-containing protein [Streptomyces sp. NPDC127066]|uniref:LPXTG cell wall anchor domain-containing protein n=1 Tax=Streptomyces sp. NPDC127066 TaxID=3347125 RepID=UPI00364F4BAE
MRQRIRPSHLRKPAAFVAAAAFAAAVPAFAAAPAYAEPGEASLEMSTLPSASPKPGDVYDKNVVITNKGTAAADGFTFQVRLTRGLDFPEEAKGCTYSTIADQVRQALCELDTVIEPGASVETPVRFKALPEALMEVVEYGTSATGAAPGDEGFSESYRRLTLTADSSADLVAVGEDTEALAGGQQSINVQLRNDGPGRIHNQASDDQPALMVRIPKGTTASMVPQDCLPFGIDGPNAPGGTPGRATYVCMPYDNVIEVGQTLTYTFMLDVAKGTKTTDGSVKATSVYDIHPAFDKNPANDTAKIHVAIPTDNEEDPSPSPSATSPGTSSGGNDPEGQSTGGSGGTGSTGSTSAGSTTGGSTAGSAGGSLANTGSDGTPFLVGAAAATAALGGGLVLAVRRRRAV